jgi:hypothetical protein
LLVDDFDAESLFFTVGGFVDFSSVALPDFVLDVVSLAFPLEFPHSSLYN